MDFGDRLKHTAEVAKWKASQQKRLMQINSTIGNLGSEIRKRKIALADRVLSLHDEGDLSEEDLNVLCSEIVDMREEVAEQKNLQMQIKEEQPPEQSQGSVKASQRAEHTSGSEFSFTCPNCNHAIPEEASFCTHCGNSIPPSQEKEIEDKPEICPNCEARIPIEAGFCPGCGNRIPAK